MAWLFGSGRKAPAGHSESKAARDRQIANLHERVPGLQIKSNDNSLYEIRIAAPPDGAMVMLRVFLPTKFPADRPVLQLISQGTKPRVSHPWVNQYMQVVGHPDLHGWDGTNPPMIGDIVAAVIQEFRKLGGNGNSSGRDQEAVSWRGQRPPPTGLSAAQTTPGTFGTGSPPYRSTASGIGEVSASGQGRANPPDTSASRARETGPNKKKPKHHTPIPAIPAKFDELQSLPTQRLSRLLEDNVARQALLLGMTSVVEMKGLRTDVLKGNVETARSTVSKQETARGLREEGEQLRLALKDLQTSYEGKTHGRNKNLGGTADQVILKQVKHASKLADTSSERVANDFLEKSLPAPQFLEEFLKERQRYHMLAAKIECMKRDIRF